MVIQIRTNCVIQQEAKNSDKGATSRTAFLWLSPPSSSPSSSPLASLNLRFIVTETKRKSSMGGKKKKQKSMLFNFKSAREQQLLLSRITIRMSTICARTGSGGRQRTCRASAGNREGETRDLFMQGDEARVERRPEAKKTEPPRYVFMTFRICKIICSISATRLCTQEGASSSAYSTSRSLEIIPVTTTERPSKFHGHPEAATGAHLANDERRKTFSAWGSRKTRFKYDSGQYRVPETSETFQRMRNWVSG